MPANVDVIQIIPAIGWSGVFEDSTPTSPAIVLEAACFALHRNGVIEVMFCGDDGSLFYASQFRKGWKLVRVRYDPSV